jgi:hypothetical protein
MEQVVVITSAAVLMAIAMPTVKGLFNTMETPAGTKALISSALASARAIAAKEQRYAGIRFQHAYDRDEPDDSPFNQPQYIIFILQDYDATGLVHGFRSVEGFDPIKLPESIGVMDLYINGNERIDINTELDAPRELIDTTTFSIVFSPAGKLIVSDVRTRNRDGYYKNDPDQSEDDIFNKEKNVIAEIAMFLQDDYETDYGLDEEPSRRSFIIYDRNEFKTVDERRRYTDYIEDIEPIFLNPYTGRMIDR